MPVNVEAALDALVPIVREHAVQVDADAAFPKASIEAFLKSELAGLLIPTDNGGAGLGVRQAVQVVERLAQECGSTAMVVTMHYAGACVIAQLGDAATKEAIAKGEHLSTLAFSEAGSRSQFWAPVSTATKDGDSVVLNADKSWITSAGHATAYVWSSQPMAAEGPSSIWLLPANTPGVTPNPGAFNGIGLRGNDSRPTKAENAKIPASNLLGEDGKGLDVMLNIVLPHFNAMIAAVGVGLMEASTASTCAHAGATKFQHTGGSPLCDLPTIRAYIARMRCKTDAARLVVQDCIDAMENGREDTMLRVLECKAVAGESATEVTDLAMRVCGGAAFRKDVGVERRFRDARAGTIMAPTTDHLYDFIGKAVCGMDVF